MRVVADESFYQRGDAGIVTTDPDSPTTISYGVVAAFRPTTVSPSVVPAGGTVEVALTGESFRTSHVVKLTSPGRPAVIGTVVGTSADRTRMQVSFPLAGVQAGSWALTLEQQYGPYARVDDAITVIEG